jgi:hypothetical protein
MRQGRQYVLFAGLLDAAHAQGLKGIDTELLQVPSDENGRVAVVKAKVQMEDGRTFSGIGDASPENVGRNIAPHVIRMAETRAKARALRDAVNVGATALEELGAEAGDEAAPSYPPQGRPSPSGRGGGQSRSGAGEQDAVKAVPDEAPAASETAANGSSEEASGARRSGGGGSQARRGSQKARKSQVDLLRTLAEELRGENGVARLEGAIGKPLSELTKAEADEWIDRLTPAEGRE